MEKNKEEKLSLILGSGSPRRKELLSYLNIPFTIITADLEEHSDSTEPSLFKWRSLSKKEKLFLIH